MTLGDKTGASDTGAQGMEQAPDAPIDLAKRPVKQSLGRFIRRLMLEKGWHQSELSRRSGIPRDSISTYIRDKAVPSTLNVQKLASALGVKPEDLMPDTFNPAIDRQPATLELKQTPSGDAWVHVNRVVSMATAVKLAELLSNDKTSD